MKRFAIALLAGLLATDADAGSITTLSVGRDIGTASSATPWQDIVVPINLRPISFFFLPDVGSNGIPMPPPVTGVTLHWQVTEAALSPNITNVSANPLPLTFSPTFSVSLSAAGTSDMQVLKMAPAEPTLTLAPGQTFRAYTSAYRDAVNFTTTDVGTDFATNPQALFTGRLSFTLPDGFEATGNLGWAFGIRAYATYDYLGPDPPFQAPVPEPSSLVLLTIAMILSLAFGVFFRKR